MNFTELVKKGTETLVRVVEVVSLEDNLRSARNTRIHLLSAYGEKAWLEYPTLMGMVDNIYLLRVAGVVTTGLIAVGFCAAASGIFR